MDTLLIGLSYTYREFLSAAGMVTVLQNTTVLSVGHFAKVHANKCTATGVKKMRKTRIKRLTFG
jgi:hypothetical protein